MKSQDKRVLSYVEIRVLPWMLVAALALSAAVPLMVWATDLNGDNLDDTWEAQYGFSTNAYASTNLVGWWQMEPNETNSVVDSTTNSITGSLTNFPGTPFATGLFSNALDFPATGQVNFTTNSALNSASGQFTFSAWFQSSTTGTPATIATWVDLSGNSWSIGADSTGTAGITFTDSLDNTQTIAPTSGAISLYDGMWHQVAVTYDTNQLATVYVDGQSQASGTITSWSSGDAASFTLGVPDDISTNQPYALDDTRLYNRALSSGEVSQLPPTYSDFNGTGLSVLQDYLEGLDPLATNVLVTPDFASSGLASYYGTNLPTLAKQSGDNQVVAAGAVAGTALVVQVTDASSNPLVGAPVTFAIKSGSDGGISQTSGGATVNSISLVTDGDGYATIYYQADADVLKNNSVTATAVTGVGDVTVCFKEHCGLQDGLASWLNGDVGVTADGSSFVSQWTDQSPNTNSAVQSTSGIQPQLVPSGIEGHSVLRFDGSSTYLAMPTCIADDFTMVVVFRSSLGTGAGTDWYAAGGIVDAETGGVVNDFGMSLDPQGTILTGIGDPDTTIPSSVGGYNDGRGHIATFTRTESTADFSQYVDSVLQGTQNNGNTSPLTDPPQITIGATQTLANYFGGDVAEVLLFSRNLSAGEQAELEGFLADKYGIYSPDASWMGSYDTDTQAQIAAYGWDKAQADAYVAFMASPPAIPTSGLLVWLKADTGITADGSGNVQEWVDQSPSGHIVYQSSEIAPPVLSTDSNGNSTVVFTPGQALISPDYIPANNDFTIIAIAADQDPGNFHAITVIGGVSNLDVGKDRGFCDEYGSQGFDLYYAGTSGGADAAAGEQVVESLTYQRSSGNANFYLRGASNGTGNVAANDLGSGLVIGNTPDFALPFNGSISSILIYDHVLSDTDRNQAEGFLADQYQVYQPYATWPLAYGADVQELISENAWNKTMADAYVASLGGGVAPPVASPPGGNFSSSQTVTVTSSTSDATIYYTTDGTTPTTGSPSIANGDSLTVSATGEYKFLAADGVAANSAVTTAVFVIGDAGSLAAGDSFTMVRKPDGTVWEWGDNWRGQIGDNQAEIPLGIPQAVPSLTSVTSIAAAGDHALAVTSDGSAWAWGADDQSQGGDGGTSDLLVPTQITALSGISSVYAAPFNGFAVDSSGNLFGWGDNSNGQLGDGTTTNQSTPEALTGVSNVLKVAASPFFTLVLESDGTVWATGNNDSGQLADGTQNAETAFQQITSLSNVVDIAVGNEHALALLADGSVWSWGYGSDGELGHGGYSNASVPARVFGLPKAVAVRAITSKSYVVLADGTVRCFGANGEGEFGLGVGVNNNNQPSPISPVGVRNVTMLAAGSYHTVVSTSTGAFYGWGDNSACRLTQDFTDTSFNSGIEVHDPLWQGFTKAACVNGSTVALKSDGTAWSTGANSGGALGSGSWLESERPVQVAGLSNAVAISSGCAGQAIDGDGNLWVWGGNWDGQLGIGTGDWLNSAQQVTDVSNVISAASGDNHALIAESDGSVWASGDDSQGELGDGTTDQEFSFIEVTGISDATQVAAGTNTSFVLESDGSVWAWGQNDTGQLGLGTTDNVTTPTQITDLPAMVAISVFGNNAMGIDTAGNVWSWGSMGNWWDGTPYEQPNVSNVVAVAAGSYHELAVQSDGTVWGLGADFAGQLGDPTYTDQGEFTQFPDVAGAVAVAANYDTTFIVKQDGTIAAFGDCNNGQLGSNLGVYDVAPKRLFGIGMSETAPSVTISTPSGGDSETEGTAISFQASASASAGSIAKVEYYLNGVKIGTSTTSGTWDFSWTPTTYGDLTFEAVAVDTAGVAQISSPVTVSVAYSPSGAPGSPTPPTNVTVTAGAPGTVYVGWTNGSGASSILIQEQNPDGSWTTIDTITDPTLTSDEITGLTTGQDYNFRVIESNTAGTASGDGAFSAATPNLPVLTTVAGDDQVIASSTFAATGLTVQAKDSTGNALANVPLIVSIPSGSDGGLALTDGGSTSSSQSVTTNTLGQATVYYQSGADTLQNNKVKAVAVSGTQNVCVNFTEHCGLQSGLDAWFRSDLGVVATGTTVTQWTDQSSSHVNVTQDNSYNSPTTATDSGTGKPVLAFDGSMDQYLSSDSQLAGLDDVTIITVASSTVSSGASGTLVSIGGLDYSDTNRIFGYDSGALSFSNGSDVSDGGSAPVSNLMNLSSVTYQASTGTANFYSEGTANGTVTVSSSPIGAGLTIGTWYTAWTGNVAEVLIYNRVLTTEERQQVELGLADKYGVYAPGATWIAAYDSDVQLQIVANQWNKFQADEYVADPDVPSITSAITASAQTRTSFSYQITATNNPTSFDATGLPPGLSIDTTTGIISGVPTTDAVTDITLTASNIRGTSAPSTLELTTTGDINLALAGTASASPTTSGGGASDAIDDDPYSEWYAAGDNQWLEVDLGQVQNVHEIDISWDPYYYGVDYAIQVSNDDLNWTTVAIAFENSDSQPIYSAINTYARYVRIYGAEARGSGWADTGLYAVYEFQIWGAPGTGLPIINSTTNAAGTIGTAFNYQITATNSPTSYDASGLPDGLSINTSTGAISGTPTTAGTYPVALSATNGADTSLLESIFTIYPAEAPAVTVISDFVPEESGRSASFAIQASNNPTGYTSTTLPAGLSLDSSTGVISGTPTAPGYYPVTVTATNFSGSGSATLIFNIYSSMPVTSGLVAWYDADTNITTTLGSLVTTWGDRSGNGNDVTPVSGYEAPSLSSDPDSGNATVNFDGVKSLSGAALNIPGTSSNDITIITVGKSSGFLPILTYAHSYDIYKYVGGYVLWDGLTLGGTPTGTGLSITTGVYDSSVPQTYYYAAGVQEGNYYETPDPLGGNFSLGAGASGQPGTGEISELIIYNRVLTTAERQAVELYLATKYNTQYTAGEPPTISPDGGADPSSVAVTISGGPAPLIRYTLDGSMPTSDSASYTGTITLTQSAPVTAAFFLGTTRISDISSAQFYVDDSGSIGISDTWQTEYFGHTGIDPNALAPGGSGLTNLQAYLYGYDPTKFSTNGDGLSDLVNHQLGYAGDNDDINGDGLTNAQDLALGLDPFDSGVNPPPTSPPAGTPGDTVPPSITLVSPQGATLIP